MSVGQPKTTEPTRAVDLAAETLLAPAQQRGCCAAFWTWLCGEREPYRPKTDAELRDEYYRQLYSERLPEIMIWP